MITLVLSTHALAGAVDPLADAVDAMQVTANAHYTGSDPVQDVGVPTRLLTSTFEQRLGDVQALLQAEGCTIDADLYLSGAFGRNITTGADESANAFVGSLTTSPKLVSGTLGLDDIGDVVGVWDGQHRFVMNDGADFYVGQAARVKGTRGVFMGLKATCGGGTSPETVLASWFDGDLTGLDQPDTGGSIDLTGGWQVVGPCTFGGFFSDIWRFQKSGADYIVSSGSINEAVSTGLDWFAISGQANGLPVNGGIAVENPTFFVWSFTDSSGQSCSGTGVPLPQN